MDVIILIFFSKVPLGIGLNLTRSKDKLSMVSETNLLKLKKNVLPLEGVSVHLLSYKGTSVVELAVILIFR